MARKGIIHRDLKPEHVLFRNKDKGIFEFRLADFGHSMVLNGNKIESANINGTIGYIAPEALKYKYYSNKTDIFSVGVILYNMCTLQNMFHGDSD